MRRLVTDSWKRFLLVLVLLSLCVVLTRPDPADAFGERLVLAFYYAWFDHTTWDMGLSDQPLQPYASSDPAAIERHVQWAQQAGIDAFVQSWYGPQVENNQTEPNFSLLLDISAQRGFASAVDFEVTSPFFESEQQVVEGLQYVLDVHAAHPAYLRVAGRPVIFFWRQNRFSVDWWYGVRQQLDPHHTSLWIMEGVDLDYLGPFDGTHLYSVAWDPEPGATLRRWGQRVRDWNAAHGSVKYWVATVMPGYNDLVTGRSDAFVRDRAGGAYYHDCWEGAIQSGADMVVITSFNEWLEGSQIEPSVTYGDLYLNLTRELGDFYRASQPLPPDMPPPDVPPPATATPDTGDERVPHAQLPAATAVPSPTATSPPSPSPAPTATPTSTPSPSPTTTPTATPTSTPSPTVTVLPTPVPSPTPAPAAQVISLVQANVGLVVGGLALLLALGVLLRRMRG